MIKEIIDRSQSGIDREGRRFPAYTKLYEKFKGQKNVDLTLNDEMLAAIRLLNHSNGEITIGFERGSRENGKAEGNILGTYGQPKPIPGKARDFLGLPNKVLKDLVNYIETRREE